VQKNQLTKLPFKKRREVGSELRQNDQIPEVGIVKNLIADSNEDEEMKLS
jgi:hypothetical protein